MNKRGYFVGPTLGEEDEPLIYCLDSDESSMVCPEEQFSTHAKASDEEYVCNNSAFILSALATTTKNDHFILDAKFNDVSQLLEWQIAIYEKLGLTPTKNIHFSPVKNFSSFAKDLIQKENLNTIPVIGYSYLLNKVFPNNSVLNISKTVNAKTSLLPLAQKYNFSIPKSILCPLADLSIDKLKILDFPARPVYLKMDGLGGGYNVRKVTSSNELEQFLELYKDVFSGNVSVQQKIPDDFIETEHIFVIYPTRVEYLYPSIQITKDSAWYGNVFLRNPSLTDAQSTALWNAAKALQCEGYAHKKGLLVGFDSLANDREMYIIEINARWLGSLPVKRLLSSLDLLNKETIFSSFDYVVEKDFVEYMKFAEYYLYDKSNKAEFAFIPLSFSAYSTDSMRVVYYVVVGDVKEFAKTVRSLFGNDSFTMLDNSLDFMVRIL